MTITIIILAYITNVFITRYFNKLAYKNDDDVAIVPLVWFTPVLGFLGFLILYLIALLGKDNRSNWFTGKNW